MPEHDLNRNASQLGSFAVYLWLYGINSSGHGNSNATVCEKLCAVRWYHRHNLGYDPGVNAGHALLLRGIRRFTAPVTKQNPLSTPILRKIADTLDLQQPRHQLEWGGILLAYLFLLRRSEYLYIGRKHHPYVLQLGDVLFLDAQGRAILPRKVTLVGIRLYGAKNNPFGREDIRYHQKSGDNVICPVRAARWILRGATSLVTMTNQPALATGPSSGIGAKEVTSIIKNAAAAEGHNPARYSTHSIGVGGASVLLNAGADLLVINVLGRWLSSAFEQDPMLTAEVSAGLSRLMC